MSVIEDLWTSARVDTNEIKTNGNLLAQATYICSHCGHEVKMNDCQCIHCGATECDDAS